MAASVPNLALQAIRNSGAILISTATLAELQTVMNRKKFDKYVTKEIRSEFISQIIQESELIEIEEPIIACRDRKDDKFLEVAVNGKADYLITGDRDLLVLHPFRDIQIITPATFLKL
jgi:putative PIN family toxin of toxin-antitoxin system